MNKSFLLTLAAFFVASGFNSAQAQTNDLSQNSLLGPVKTIDITEYEPVKSGKKWVPGAKLTGTYMAFDAQGNMIEEILRGSNNEVLYSTNIQPFDNGKYVEYKRFSDGGELMTSESGRLDKNGQILSMKTYTANQKLTSYIKSHFDSKGNVLKTFLYDSNNSIINSKEYGYDNNSRLSFIKFKLEGGEEYVETYDYDNKGQLLNVKTIKADGTVVSETNYEYDSDGKSKVTFYPSLHNSHEHQITTFNVDGTIKELIYKDREESTIRRELYTYYTKGKLFKVEAFEKFEDGDELIPVYMINYDQYGKEIDRVIYGVNGSVDKNIETTYLVDEQNNWIEKVERDNGDAISIERRRIFYF